MKVKAMLELGNDCGLQTVSEAYSNVVLHVGMIFTYTEINKELKELARELRKLNLLVLNDDDYFEFPQVSIKEALELV